MTSHDIMNKYFGWMISIVVDDPKDFDLPCLTHCKYNHHELLNFLNQIDFVVPLNSAFLDIDRVRDATSMRIEFFLEMGEKGEDIEIDNINNVFDFPVSVLEVLVAFARKIESCVMGDDIKGDRTSRWFWTMLDNLYLINLNDEAFQNYSIASKNIVLEVIGMLLLREFSMFGEGSLFPLNNSEVDQRELSMWNQMLSYMADETLHGRIS